MSRRVQPGDPRVAIAYVRVSKDDQKLGPEAQRAAIGAWAHLGGVAVAAWHVDQGVTSVSPIDARPGLVAALASLREHRAGVLVVARRDRIARDPMLTRAIEGTVARAGAAVASAAGEATGGTTPGDVMMRGVVDLFAEYERGLIRARTKAALAALRAAGKRTGGVPFGYAAGKGGTLVPCQRERDIIDVVAALRENGLSERAIVRSLRAQGFRGRTGQPLEQTQVHLILVRRRDIVAQVWRPAVRERVFVRGGAEALDVDWARRQVAAMRAKGYSREQIARALTKCGVLTTEGEAVTEGDVEGWG